MKILFIVPPKVHLLDINGPAHIFFEAKEYGAEVDLHFVSLNEQSEIESSSGLYFSKLKTFQKFQLKKEDWVFVPGFEYELIADEKFNQSISPFFDWLKKQYTYGANICSVCTGAFLLAKAGLLDGKKCTTHWKYLSKLAETYPQIVVEKNRLFIEEENIYTSAGVASGIDLSLFILEKKYGSKFAADIAKETVIYFRRSADDPQLSIFLEYRNHLDNRIHEAQDYMLEKINNTFTLSEVAQQVNMSVRNLTRLFKKTTGITIGNYLEKLKVERAIQLLAEGNKVESVAQACGFKSTNQLRNLLRKYEGVLPSEISLRK